MPIGKDSITKRVAKTTTEEKNIAPELVATVAAAPEKAPAKKTTTTKKAPAKTTAQKTEAKAPAATAKKPAAKKTATKKETVKETVTPPSEAPAKTVETAVLTNVAPETVAAVIGHNEKEAVEIVQIGGKMPTHLL